MPDAGKTPSPEADPGRYESGELTPEEKQHQLAADTDKTTSKAKSKAKAKAGPAQR